MKYFDIQAFKQYLLHSLPCRFYLVISPNDYDREKIIQWIVERCMQGQNGEILHLKATQKTVEEVLFQFHSPSLFGGENFIIFDEIEQLNKKDIDKLVKFLQEEISSGYFLFAAKGRSVGAIYNAMQKKGIILDLSLEKPWEKEKRIHAFVKEKCFHMKKKIFIEALDIFIQRVGLDLALVEQEIDKLITYVGEKKEIEKRDVLAISIQTEQSNYWQLAEKIIEGKELSFFHMDTALFHSLIIALRHHLQVGYKIASFLKKGERDLNKYFPRMPVKVLSRKKALAEKRGSQFFKKGLQFLYEIDLLSKNNFHCFSLLLDYFRIKTHLLSEKKR